MWRIAKLKGFVTAVCPYYINETRTSITCEGYIGGAECLTRFPTVDEKERFQAARCNSFGYVVTCPLAWIIEGKYDVDYLPERG